MRSLQARSLAIESVDCQKAGLPPTLSCHTFRASGITNYRANGGSLEHAQQIAAHASARTTKLYDRSEDLLTIEEIQRIDI